MYNEFLLEVDALCSRMSTLQLIILHCNGVILVVIGGDLAPSLGGRKNFRRPNFRITFFRKRFPFSRQKFLMTFF